MNLPYSIAALAVAFHGFGNLFAAENSSVQTRIDRGRSLYALNCLICHQITGQGAPGAFPPLANSDFLSKDSDKTIQALVQGLSGPIVVNGKKFNGTMPPVILTDEQVADVLTFVRNSWGNSLGQVSAEDVKRIRARSEYPTYEALVAANSFAPLPTPPPDLNLREVVRLPSHGVRLASDGTGRDLYVLGNGGDIWKIDPSTGAFHQTLWGKSYLEASRGAGSTVGFVFDKAHRLYVVANHRDESGPVVTDNVVIYRSNILEEGEPSDLKPWFTTSYPWGIGPFNHGVGNIAFGPDGLLYVGSGSRTDGNEPGQGGRYSQAGENPITACLWRLDPKSEKPKLEIYSRGHRNPYGFCWNDKGEMFSTDNGPDADAPEEMNEVLQGHHYGFPYQFSNWTKKPYAYTPDPPAGTEFYPPIANRGPAAGGTSAQPLYTFDPHSSPSGIVFLGSDWPEEYRGGFLIGRFGNLLKTPSDAGFDVLFARLERDPKGHYQGSFKTLVAPLARPVDVHLSGKGKAYILEYTRSLKFGGSLSFPGRVLELSVSSHP